MAELAASSRRAAIIYNPTKVALDQLRPVIEDEEISRGWLPSLWFATTTDDAGEGPAREAVATSPDLLIVAGGDGTVRTVAEVVRGSGIPFAIVPAGTGNLLARNLHLPLGDLVASVRVAFGDNTRAVDVAVVTLERADTTSTTHAFVVMAGIGLDANMAIHTSSALKRRIGWLAYVEPIVRSIGNRTEHAMSVSLDGEAWRSIDAHTVIVGNTGTLTAGIVLLPNAVPDDGLLDVVVIRPKGPGGWARIASRLAVGGVLSRSPGGRKVLRAAPQFRALRYAQSRRLAVRFAQPQQMELDGDGVGLVTAATITVMPGALPVRVR
ncbi:diacylglycerol/lipid kinase family protein [Lacisediminihabitans changchengi]|uniref:NAD(+)/NADH kinase n=1 Tax=Lacisediminihabitans changchengi TaxID=2787634 RepID=A0A934W3X3_9MICO|nr:diacylglycerol kinase family protein [Lacisediminihabitans changchengi]MBK4346920.1 NAD(+)/NADH kinase [Lacisediminihabitans changchengi]MBK4347957.1 NAD(+)/NADH kinase [Lacisediminihabitans changchengi]